MPAAARILDATAHPGVIAGPGVGTVLIEGRPAAVAGDLHACAFPSLPWHPPNTIIKGSATVFIGGRPAARQGDPTGCGAPIVSGAVTVSIGD
jgi:uncharacterized Zn-binding protein involved in type VI secretion